MCVFVVMLHPFALRIISACIPEYTQGSSPQAGKVRTITCVAICSVSHVANNVSHVVHTETVFTHATDPVLQTIDIPSYMQDTTFIDLHNFMCRCCERMCAS